jgi:glycine/D-amino acid oxidase-like deaminating enzyme
MVETPSRDARATLQIHFEEEPLSTAPGETVAATLVAHGRLALSTDKLGDRRGLYCGMGVCHDCLVTIDGRPGQRACLVKAADGMRVKRQAAGVVALSSGLADLAMPPQNDLPERSVDILVVGAGPGGLAAALAARRAGAKVLILDERPAPGGQFYKQPAYLGEPRDLPDKQARDGRALIDKVRAAGADIEGETLVWGAERDGEAKIEIMTLALGQIGLVRPRTVVIATGAYERPIVVPGWTLPGVMTTGAAQTLKRSYNVSPGKRLLIAGNGPLNFQVAAELLAPDIEIVVVEAADTPWSRPADGAALFAADPRLALLGMATIARLKRARAAIHWRCRLIAIEGGGRAERAIVAPLAADGRIQCERSFDIAVDAVLTGDGFWPASELPRLLGCRQRVVGAEDDLHLEAERRPDGATSLEDVFIVGEAGAFGGAHVALAQGELAGVEAARRLGYAGAASSSASGRLAHHHRFQTALWRLFATPRVGLALARDDTPICRCESVTLGALRETIAKHAVKDVATLKRLTRAGMGRCQGRYCAPHLVELVGKGSGSGEVDWPAPQMPLRPIPLAALAIEKPEWRGHKRVLFPPLSPSRADQLEVSEAETLVIGAGIVGLSTALFLARAGQSVVVLDHAQPNGGASGANAGSLHAQLLSFDYGAKARGYVDLAAKALPLQAESIRLWRQLAHELDADFEIRITGGLMLAETERDLVFLDEKTRIERAQGIECEIIGAADLRKLEPALNETFLGAAYCAQEGKINPLTATQGLLDAAIAAGARIYSEATVTGIRNISPGFSIETSRGPVKAQRVVNAAGAFAAQIGAMLGVRIPVFGAPLQMIVTEAAEPTISRLIAHADRHLTLKQATNGNFIIGGGWTAGLDPVHHRPRPLRASLEGNLWIAQHVIPSLRKLHVIRSWAAMNIDIDGAPILGEHPAIPGFFNAVTSNGYTLGPIMGLTTAELVVSGRAERDISSFGIERFGGM